MHAYSIFQTHLILILKYRQQNYVLPWQLHHKLLLIGFYLCIELILNRKCPLFELWDKLGSWLILWQLPLFCSDRSFCVNLLWLYLCARLWVLWTGPSSRIWVIWQWEQSCISQKETSSENWTCWIKHSRSLSLSFSSSEFSVDYSIIWVF